MSLDQNTDGVSMCCNCSEKRATVSATKSEAPGWSTVYCEECAPFMQQISQSPMYLQQLRNPKVGH